VRFNSSAVTLHVASNLPLKSDRLLIRVYPALDLFDRALMGMGASGKGSRSAPAEENSGVKVYIRGTIIRTSRFVSYTHLLDSAN